MRCSKSHGTGRVRPRGFQNSRVVSGRVWSGGFQILWVGSGGFRNLAGCLVGSADPTRPNLTGEVDLARTCTSSTCQKRMTPSTESGCGYFSYALTYQRRCYQFILQFHEDMRARVRTDDGEYSERLGHHSGVAARMCAVATSVRSIFRCCHTRHAGTLL